MNYSQSKASFLSALLGLAFVAMGNVEGSCVITNGDDPDPGPVCSLPADSGPCEAYMPSWYFNSETGQCEEFIYGGCEGNDNRFSTLEECSGVCGGPQ
jgi:hypothetical protein